MPPHALLLRRLLCCSAAAGAVRSKKKSIVFLGSPQVSTLVLDALLVSSQDPSSNFEIAAVVTQPPAQSGRGWKMTPSPVSQHAMDRGFSKELIFTPENAGEEAFLSNLKALNPDVCITAAYGNILPRKFLSVPSYGIVNIHPSLLPLYRGAAPVQRALQDGVTQTGVSLVYTVHKLDSGPIIAYDRVEVNDFIKAPELLLQLFDLGSQLLVRKLPSILDGSARVKAQEQCESNATLAPKLTSEESWLSFDQEANVLHNKVRAFAGWPGTRAKIRVTTGNSHLNEVDIKIVTTRVSSACGRVNDGDEISFINDTLIFPCARKTFLEVLELQLPGKKVMNARDFWNGLRGQNLKKVSILKTLR